MHMYEDGLQRCNANYSPLTPVDFLVRASEVYGDKTAALYGQVKRAKAFGSTFRLGPGSSIPQTMQEGPRDGETIGEVASRVNLAMKGDLKYKKATEEEFAGGWFHSWHSRIRSGRVPCAFIGLRPAWKARPRNRCSLPLVPGLVEGIA